MQWLSDFILNLKSKHIVLIAIVGSFILYGNTLSHDYALDDAIVITKNEFTKQGIKGIPDILTYDSFTGFFGKEKQLVDGGRYRPFSIITFAVEYQFFGESPLISHFINILIYAFIVYLIYLLFFKLFEYKLGQETSKKIALVTSVLFLLHPIHTEVVANIKGRDELLSLLFSLLTFVTLIKYHSSRKIHLFILSGIYMFLGLMSKENTIAFLVIIPLGFMFFQEISKKQLVLMTALLASSSMLFLILRYRVLGGFQGNVASELMNNPFVNATGNQQIATIFYTWVIYFKLLFFPHPLTFDYYPKHIPLVDFSNPLALFSIIILLVLIVLTFIGIKRKSVVGFALFSFAATFSMVSNLLFSVGTFMNERFVFMPSLFFCLAVSYLAIQLFQRNHRIGKSLVLISGFYVILFFPVKTIGRNLAWKNDLTLFTTDVKTSANSAKSNCSAGGKLWEEGKTILDKKRKNKLFKQSEIYLRKSIKIYPDYVDAWLLLGNVLFDYKKDIEGSVNCFIEVIKRQPYNNNAWQNSGIVLQKTDNRELQLKYYKKLQLIDSNRYQINYRLGVLYGRYFGDLNSGINYLKKATEINPQKVEALKDLGTAYGIVGREKDAYTYCKKALELDKSDAQIYINLGIASSKLGLNEEAEAYFKKAEVLKQNKSKQK